MNKLDKIYETELIKLIEGIVQNAIKQTILMNQIIEMLLKYHNNGEAMAVIMSDCSVSISEIYNMAIEHMNNVEKIFDFENEVPDCLIQLRENIAKFGNTFTIENEHKVKLKP